MRHETITQMVQQRNRDKANGVKHTPLHTLQECCEEAGISPVWFGRHAAHDPDAPQPVLSTPQTAWRAKKKYYRKHEFVQWVNQVRQQKEKAMPDIKTALQAALAKTANEWAAEDEAHHKTEPTKETTMQVTESPKPYFTTTNNVCRATFEAILRNPGKSRKQVIEALLEGGYKDTSTSTLIGQMIKQNHVRESNGLLYAVNTDYKPLKGSKAWAKLQAKQQGNEQAPPRKHVEITSKRTGKVINPRPAPAPAPTTREWTVDSVISSLNVRQAMAVYDELRKIFGG